MPRLSLVAVAIVLASPGCGGGGDDATGGPIDATDATADALVDAAREAGLGDAPGGTATDAPTRDTAPEAPLDGAPETPSCPGEEPEPNDTEPAAVPLAAIDSCDSSGSTFSGWLSGGGDVDHWHYQGRDTLTCTADPTASTKDAVEVCVFVACLSGPTQINGCPAGAPATSQAKLGGCCAAGPGKVVVDFKCTLTGSSNDADVYVRVRSPKATACTLYDVSYHY